MLRCRSARLLFLLSAGITAAILLGIQQLRLSGGSAGLTPSFFVLFATLDFQGAAMWLLVLVGAALLCRPAWRRPTLCWIADHGGIVALAVAVVLSAGSVFVYRNHPLGVDEYAAYFQGQAFASGSLTGRFPPALLNWVVPPSFQNAFLNISDATGQVTSAYWPSFSLLLTPFAWLGIPWACNPIISALTALLVLRLALQVFDDREAAGLAVLLTIASPVFFANGISYYSMSAELLTNGAFAVLLFRPNATRALAAGVVGSIALTLHNPVPHFLFAVPWLIWIARRKNGPRLLGFLCAGYAPLSLLLGVGWYAFSRHLVHESLAMVAGASPATASFGGLLKAAFDLPSPTLLLARAIGLAKVWLWAVPGLPLIAGIGGWKLRDNVACRLLAASALVTLAGYLFVPFDQGHGWGFRYFYPAWIALPVLAAGALARKSGTRTTERGFGNDETRAFVVTCALLTLVGGVGFRAWQIRQFVSNDLKQAPAYSGTGRRVVIIDPRLSFYGEDLVQNDPFLRGPVIRMLSHGAAADTEMMHEHFPQMQRVFADAHGSVWSAASAERPEHRAYPNDISTAIRVPNTTR